MVLARAGGDAFRVLLLRRPESSRFAAGAYVFSGGCLDPADEDPRVLERLGPAVSGDEPRFLAAAIREQFEETGVLLAANPPSRAELRAARRRLTRGEVTFPELVERLDLDFGELPVAYFARWITPARLARRYDARFFLARHPGGEPEPGEEHTGAVWLTPRVALERYAQGRLPMLFPTRKVLERLAGFRELDRALEVLRGERVEPVRPRLVSEEGVVRPVLPGDPRYASAGSGALEEEAP